MASMFVLFCFISQGQNLKALDDKYGFREAKLEMPVSAFKNIEYHWKVIEESLPDEKTYTVEDAELKIGDYSLDEIEYVFYKGYLMTIDIEVSEGTFNQEGVLKVLEAAYGKGIEKTANGFRTSYSWQGGKVSMYFYIDHQLSHNGYISIISEKLFAQRVEDIKLLKLKQNQKILDAAKKL
jgi:hypothetical protein